MATPRKPRKTTGKKTVAKAGGSKSTTPRKATKHKYQTKPLSKREVNKIVKGPSAKEVNARRLAEDIQYYRDADKDRPYLRYKGADYQIGQFKQVEFGNPDKGYISPDGKVRLTKYEYNKIIGNPLAVPHYVPIHGTTKTGRKAIVGYRNAKTNEIVSSHYRFQVLGKYFKPNEPANGDNFSEEEQERGRLYDLSNEYWKRKNKERTADLIESYRLKKLAVDKIELTEQEVIADADFQALCDELLTYSAEQHQFTKEYVNSINFDIQSVNDKYGTNILSGFTAKDLQNAVGSDPRYKEILVLLGRRLPSETRPVGSYGPGYIKTTVVPYMDLLMGSKIFEGDE